MINFVNSLILFILSVIVILIGEISANEPLVKIKNGNLLGSLMQTRNGKEFSAFQGIPYAKPPLDELRFLVSYFEN